MPMERMLKGGLNKKEAEMVVKSYNSGQISKKQYDKMPPKLLLGIAKKGARKKK